MSVEDRVDVAVIALVVLAFDREGRDGLVGDQASGYVVLDRKGIRRANEHRRPAGLQGLEEIRGLGRHMQAGSDDEPGERPLTLEPLADRCERSEERRVGKECRSRW